MRILEKLSARLYGDNRVSKDGWILQQQSSSAVDLLKREIFKNKLLNTKETVEQKILIWWTSAADKN